MNTTRLGRVFRRPALSEDVDQRLVSRSRWAGVGVLLVFASVGVFMIWSSQVTSHAARRAEATQWLSETYDGATTALTAQESLEHEYQLEPSPSLRVSFYQQDAALAAALQQVSRDGGPRGRALVQAVQVRYSVFMSSARRLFAAVDEGDPAAVQLIHESQVDPAYKAVEAVMAPAVASVDQEALDDLVHLERLETVNARLSPVVFLAGLLMTVIMALLSGGYRRQLEAARARAAHDSLHDELTGLPNRRLFVDRVDQALRASQRSDNRLGVLLIDLDRFKEVNDTLGHDHGDELLIQVGRRMTALLRRSDTVARLGGDEFAVLLPDLEQSRAAEDVAAKLTDELTRTFSVRGIDLDLEASIGVVVHVPVAGGRANGDADIVADAGMLLQRADLAMYLAKARNLDHVVYDSETGHQSSAVTLTLLGELRRALERDELRLHYQPKISARTGELVGVEALVRWQHPTRGLIYPDAFIPVAEHTGLIGALTLTVLKLALTTARRWADAGNPLPVAVNLSARNLLDEQLPDQISDLLTAHRVPAELLHLEVTESAIILDPARARRILNRLSTLGLRISIDDFGAGYTSLAQLRDLPVDELKIDRSFVMTMLEDPANAVIVRSVIELGHNLSLAIVAEGVETAAALAALAALNCDIAQGYFISRPLAPDVFDTWRQTRRTEHPSPT